MKKYKVSSIRKFPHPFTPVSNVGEYLDSIDSFGDKTMFVWKEKDGLCEMTYRDFVTLVRSFSLGLTEQFGDPALTGGRRIAVMGETSPYWVVAYLAILASGNTAVPMDKELAESEIANFFRIADISAVVHSAAFEEMYARMLAIRETDPAFPLDTRIPIDFDGEAPAGVIPFSSIVTLGEHSLRTFTPDCDTERCCELLFTSGTTGTSKCVMLCQRNIFSVISSADEATEFGPDDVLVSVLPLHHTYELACMLAGFNYGMKVCINDSLRHVMKSFKEFQPTGLVLVPLFVNTMYKRIQSEARKAGKEKILEGATRVSHYLKLAGVDVSGKLFADVREAFGGRLRKIICGGAALNPEMIEAFDAFGISIYEGYGITECAPLVAVTPYYRRKVGSIGPACSCCEVKIDGMETNEAGQVVGEILVRGSNVMLGYLNNDEANAAAFTEDGWFRTGDVGYMDEDGYVTITGRKKSVIVLDNGKNVFPEEIEEYLEGIDLIAESVVVGREEEDGTKLVAVIFPNYEKYRDYAENDFRTAIQQEITALNKRLPSFKQIHRLEFRKTEFEKTTTRKIKRHLVK